MSRCRHSRPRRGLPQTEGRQSRGLEQRRDHGQVVYTMSCTLWRRAGRRQACGQDLVGRQAWCGARAAARTGGRALLLAHASAQGVLDDQHDVAALVKTGWVVSRIYYLHCYYAARTCSTVVPRVNGHPCANAAAGRSLEPLGCALLEQQLSCYARAREWAELSLCAPAAALATATATVQYGGAPRTPGSV